MSRLRSTLVLIFLTAALGAGARVSAVQSITNLTPAEREIEKQRLRLTSAEEEERRDAFGLYAFAGSFACLFSCSR
jgi:hypothetical protein